ncbi:MAG: 3-phosphoglycerate dehydrogenase [Flavobacteriales bacterium]|nr:3-phosphoglycerate dehydrogenase [Flavobacteriales bacterium]
MAFILANDGIDAAGKAILEAAGHNVQTDRVPQEALADFLKENNVAALLVRSATQVTAIELASGTLKVVGRTGVGMDNIDLQTAERLGITVANTPAASSRSVAELVMAHAMGLMRFLPESNREMPTHGTTEFAKLKKKFGNGREVEGRTMGIIGLGRIGRMTAQLALGMGMKVVAHDPFVQNCEIGFNVYGFGEVTVPISTRPFDEVLAQCDILSLHVPGAKHGAVIGKDELWKMQRGAIIINASRGGVIDEQALLEALDSGHIAAAGLDVFVNEPAPDPRLLNHPRISVTPHIGAATEEAQERIGIELAHKVAACLG